MSRIRFPIEVIRDLYSIKKMINAVSLEEIEWTENGQPMDIDPHVLETYARTGLSNFDFVHYGLDEADLWAKRKK